MKRKVNVIHEVEVEYDEKAFTPEFMDMFRSVFYNFRDVEEHIDHIAACSAMGIIGFNNHLEGYGNLKEMGVKINVVGYEVEEDY